MERNFSEEDRDIKKLFGSGGQKNKLLEDGVVTVEVVVDLINFLFCCHLPFIISRVTFVGIKQTPPEQFAGYSYTIGSCVTNSVHIC